jgi:hypothetical protein
LVLRVEKESVLREALVFVPKCRRR